MTSLKGRYRYIFLDADDTLWENEKYFREAKRQFALLLSSYTSETEIARIFNGAQETNIPVFGYGSKTCMIGFLDTVAEICGNEVPSDIYRQIKSITKGILTHEMLILDGVEDTLKKLSREYRLIVATKGENTEQEAKFLKSGLSGYFSGIEVMLNKDEKSYCALAAKYGLTPEEILMAGNSVRSDIAPVLGIGGTAIYIPHEPVWEHELMDLPVSDRVIEVENFSALKNLLL